MADSEHKTDPSTARTEDQASEPVWTYRGYRLQASQFTTAMVHLFRAEVQRANVWRVRLDTTTNWAVVATGAALSFAFAQSESNHAVIPLNIVLVTLFLMIEARRYRYYELWSYRVRLMETDFFASMLVPPFHPAPDWAEALSEHLLHPHFSISFLEAIGRRLRNNYLWIYAVLALAWMAKLWLLPTSVTSWGTIFQRASIGALKGDWVLLTSLVFYIILLVISVATIGLQQATGEVLPRYGGLIETIRATGDGGDHEPGKVRSWFRLSTRRKQLLTFIVTDRTRAVTERILRDMNRGVTALAGTGMYTGEEHSVLMCALTVTEVPQLKSLVRDEDPNAFVIVSPAQEVFGKGFMPLKDER